MSEATEIIEEFIRAIGVMPIYWKEFVGDELADRATAFITKHDPDSLYADDDDSPGE